MLPAVLVAGALSPEFTAAATAAGACLLRYGSRLAPYLQRLPALFNTAAEEMPYAPNALNRAGNAVHSATTALSTGTVMLPTAASPQ